MVTGPGHEKAAAAAGRARAATADRDYALDVLKVAFVQGRLSMDELDARAGQAYTARTQAELAAVTADLPAGLAGPRPRKAARPRMGNGARWCAAGLITPAVLGLAYALSSLRGEAGWAVMALVVAIGYFIFWLSVGTDMLWQWHSMAVPTSGMCVRCAHTVASHRTSATCGVRPGTLNRRPCRCAGYLPPGVLPETTDLSLQPSFPA